MSTFIKNSKILLLGIVLSFLLQSFSFVEAAPPVPEFDMGDIREITRKAAAEISALQTLQKFRAQELDKKGANTALETAFQDKESLEYKTYKSFLNAEDERRKELPRLEQERDNITKDIENYGKLDSDHPARSKKLEQTLTSISFYNRTSVLALQRDEASLQTSIFLQALETHLRQLMTLNILTIQNSDTHEEALKTLSDLSPWIKRFDIYVGDREFSRKFLNHQYTDFMKRQNYMDGRLSFPECRDFPASFPHLHFTSAMLAAIETDNSLELVPTVHAQFLRQEKEMSDKLSALEKEVTVLSQVRNFIHDLKDYVQNTQAI